MTSAANPDRLAARLGDRVRATAGPWEVYAERARRYEVHFNGTSIELVRGPIIVEGYGIRLFRPKGKETGVGYQASTDLSDDGVRAAIADAEEVSHVSRFPAQDPALPASTGAAAGPELVDPALWSDPARSLDDFAAKLFASFEGRAGVVPSFGSAKATLAEISIANSRGLDTAYAHTIVETEIGVKSFGGPEGRPPGEYWVTGTSRRVEADRLPALVDDWARYARDARNAASPPTGQIPVVLPPDVSEGFIPAVIGFKLGAVAALRELAIPAGTRVGGDDLTIYDDGTVDWAVGSAPIDDEGTPRVARPVVVNGRAAAPMSDVLHARALDSTSTGNAGRGDRFRSIAAWGRFHHAPSPRLSTAVIPPGSGGSDAELVEQVEDGIWVQQIGWAQPDILTGRFGGEIRIGYRIRHGKLAEPVRGGVVGGMVIGPEGTASLFSGLSARGSKSQLVPGLSTPTLVVQTLSVSGEAGAGATASP